ncbi:MAG TPA: permease prefix domain 1-containing protein [Gemmataceae bacterium]|jgi:hypothetical protein
MDKLEQYLDQVCRGIGGPRALRQHVRQELREHLLDALAGHKAAGLPEDQALARALADFGGPDEVRSELEAAHGHRLMAVVIDKAMQWKEKTMRAKWLWTTWAHLAVVGVIAVLVTFVVMSDMFVTPKVQRLLKDAGAVELGSQTDAALNWCVNHLAGMRDVLGNYPAWLVIVPAVAWGLFEWRVRGENKALVRLSALGTVAVGLAVVAMLMTAAQVISLTLVMPGAMNRPPERVAEVQAADVDDAVAALNRAAAARDWDKMRYHARQAASGVAALVKTGAPGVVALREPAKVDDVRSKLTAAEDRLRDVQRAIADRDMERVTDAVQQFSGAYGPVRATMRPQR